MGRAETESDRRWRYAQRDVLDKLGIKWGMAVCTIGARPSDALLARVRQRTGRRMVSRTRRPELVLYWPGRISAVRLELERLRREIAANGGIWVISAKRGSQPYLPDAVLIPMGLAAGLVDNKVCSVSSSETAMRFVIRRKERPRGR